MTRHQLHAHPAGGQTWRSLAPLILILLLGAGLRTAQYFGQVGLWADEIAVARNVEDRGMPELLTEPLDHNQVAPVGFLAVVEAATRMVGTAESGLRFGPWLFGLASLLLFWRVAARFSEGPGLLAVLALFAFSPALIWYGSSVKPYGSDVTISLLLAWLALRYLERPEDARLAAVGGSVGAVALLCSFPAVPTAAILGGILVIGWWSRRPRPRLHPLLVLLAGWGAGIAAAGIAATRIVDDATDAYMRDFWADRFPPTELPEALPWAASSLYDVFAHSLIFVPPSSPVLVLIVALPLVLGLVGLGDVLRHRPIRAAILLAPPIAALAAAAIHLLPFGQRLGLHAAWPFLVLAGAGLAYLHSRVEGGWRWLTRSLAAAVALPLVLIVLVTARPPLEGVSAKDVLEELATEVREDDRIYVFGQAGHDMVYYGARVEIEEWVQGSTHYDDPGGYLREVDELRGEPRVWFVWTVLGGRGEEHPAWINEYLSTIGHEVQRIEDAPAGAVLYDLSDPERLGEASVETFPLPPP